MKLEELQLTPLQHAALDRIHFFEDALEKRGLKVRMSFEQEFLIAFNYNKNKKELAEANLTVEAKHLRYMQQHYVVDFQNGILQSNEQMLNSRGKLSSYDDIVKVLQPHIPSLIEIEREYAVDAEFEWEKLPIYEAKFDAGHDCHRKPSDIALDVLRFRQNVLPILLHAHESGAQIFRPEWIKDHKDKIPNLRTRFDSLPANKDVTISGIHNTDTCEFLIYSNRFEQSLGMHVPISVYDQRGNCLCDNYGFYRALSERALTWQYEAGLGLIQSKNGLDRLGINRATPKQIGLGKGYYQKHHGYSMLERNAPSHKIQHQTVNAMEADIDGQLQVLEHILRMNGDPFIYGNIQHAIGVPITVEPRTYQEYLEYLKPHLMAKYAASKNPVESLLRDAYSYCDDNKLQQIHAWQEYHKPQEIPYQSPVDPYYPDRYLEDRLIPSDADPLVVMALKLAAVYDMVKTCPELKDQPIITKEHVDARWNYHMGEIKHELDHTIEKTMQPWVDRFKVHENHLRQLLGDPLYEGICDAYGNEKAIAR